MSDGYGSGDYGWDTYGGQQPQVIGYDEYGRPVYGQVPPQPSVQEYGEQAYDPGASYDPYPTQADAPHPPADPYADPYGPDPYAAQRAAAAPTAAQQYASDTYPSGQPYVADTYQTGTYHPDPYPTTYGDYDPYGPAADTGAPSAVPAAGYDTGTVPAQAPPPDEESPRPARDAGPAAGSAAEERGSDAEGYETEQFAFVEEETENSEDVIDWLKFTESRTERREEAKRRGRNRKRALAILLVLALLGGVGYLWYTGRLPGIGGGPGAATSATGQQRDVLVVHLRTPDSDASSTALLVDNSTTGEGTTLLLPNTLAVTTADGVTTTLAKSVQDEGATPTRDALNQLLGADIKGTWRLDTPYLEILVDTVGGITLDADATVPAEKKDDGPLVKKGKGVELDGRAAVAYATHRGDAEPAAAQLKRFGQVMAAVLQEMSTDKSSATKTVDSLGQILDPSISQASLGASLASLAERAQNDAHETRLLPVAGNGTLSAETSDGLVRDVLGGTVQNSDPDAAPRVALRNAAGDRGADDKARVDLVNGGFTVVGASDAGETRETSRVVYSDAQQKGKAEDVAKTLGLPADAVRKGDGAGNADVTVVLGGDYDF